MVGMLGRVGLGLGGFGLSDVGVRAGKEERGFMSARDVGRKEARLILCTVPSITVDRLAAKAIHKCVVGDVDNRRVLENAEVLGEDWAMGNSIAAI